MRIEITLLLSLVLFILALLSPSRKLSGRDFVECLAYALVAGTLLVRTVPGL